jgi:ATP-dependent RNA helicase HelY
MSEALDAFASTYSFPFDEFQVEACEHLAAGGGVLVAAPTGSGKTVVGEFAIWLALQSGTKCFYTTPIKALSNQKYHDLCARFGDENVGLLTGDTSINGEAPVVVMTTEVLRNMIYAGSRTLLGLSYVVMDEVHYLADRFRGAVWEEVILGLADSVQLVALSATVNNAEEFGAWLDWVRDGVAVVVSEKRPVPLFQHVMAGEQIHSLFDKRGAHFNPALMGLALEQQQRFRNRGPRGHGPGRGASLTPKRRDVVAKLKSMNLLPAIYFIFSRNGCDGAVRQLLTDGVRLTNKDERNELLAIAQAHGATLSFEDKRAIDWETFTTALGAGIAAHHAGLLPLVKSIVEEGFVRGLIKVVFATETLALGINMPAKSVVIEKLVKFNGEETAEMTPVEYTQLTGRAGRRGIDVEGHAVVLWGSTMNPKMVAGLAGKRTYPLVSSFVPSYNMAVNLVGTLGRKRAREVLQRSFAQYQADRRGGGALDANNQRGAGASRSGSARQRNGADSQLNSARGRSRDSLVSRPSSAGKRSIVREFDSVCAVLDELGYLDRNNPDSVPQQGKLLARIYNELDVVVAEGIRTGVFAPLTVPELAAVLSTLVYESRTEMREPGQLPTTASAEAETALRNIRRDIRKVERAHDVEQTKALDAGFARAAYEWASGEPLADVLTEHGLAAGDFVRWCRQVIDLSSQIAQAVGDTPLRTTARAVVAAMRRNIVDLDAD